MGLKYQMILTKMISVLYFILFYIFPQNSMTHLNIIWQQTKPCISLLTLGRLEAWPVPVLVCKIDSRVGSTLTSLKWGHRVRDCRCYLSQTVMARTGSELTATIDSNLSLLHVNMSSLRQSPGLLLLFSHWKQFAQWSYRPRSQTYQPDMEREKKSFCGSTVVNPMLQQSVIVCEE